LFLFVHYQYSCNITLIITPQYTKKKKIGIKNIMLFYNEYIFSHCLLFVRRWNCQNRDGIVNSYWVIYIYYHSASKIKMAFLIMTASIQPYYEYSLRQLNCGGLKLSLYSLMFEIVRFTVICCQIIIIKALENQRGILFKS